jgi:hypothetical protein
VKKVFDGVLSFTWNSRNAGWSGKQAGFQVLVAKVLEPYPQFYPFIVDDEVKIQQKEVCRVVIDHLTAVKSGEQ